MKSRGMAAVAVMVISGTYLNGAMSAQAATSKEAAEATAMMSSYDAEQRAAALSRNKDASWKPSCSEVGLIQVGDSKKPGALKNFCLNAEGNLLTCYAPRDAGAKNTAGIRIYSPKGELLKTLPLKIQPGAN